MDPYIPSIYEDTEFRVHAELSGLIDRTQASARASIYHLVDRRSSGSYNLYVIRPIEEALGKA